uniref:Uncharacterized protein n=1 Tax=Anopheles coluzzii TaxID=1518534 RepID=A0A8W7P1H0_ANOCL
MKLKLRTDYLPAAKCNGVDFLPAVSRAFTVCGVISFFTFARSPVLHASNSSRSGSLAMAAASRLTDSIERLRFADISLSPISDASSFGRGSSGACAYYDAPPLSRRDASLCNKQLVPHRV